MPGRKKKPQEIKDLQGTSRPDRDNRKAPKFTGKPVMPAIVAKMPEAKAEWERVVAHLKALDLLKSTDQAMLTGYCVQWALWLGALETIHVEGQYVDEPLTNRAGEIVGHKKKRHPASVVASDSMKILKGLASLFGFDPSSRTRIQLELGDDNKKRDSVEAHLNGDDDNDDDAPISSRPTTVQ